MRFNNQYKNLIDCFNEIVLNRPKSTYCIKLFGKECPDIDCDKCEYFVYTIDLDTDDKKRKFVLDILNKNLTYPKGCGVCITNLCKHTCTEYLIKKYKIEI